MRTSHLPRVSEYMDRDTHALSGHEDILKAVRRLIDEGITGAPVVDGAGRPIGLLSEYDCLRLLAEGQDGQSPAGRVCDFMATSFTTVPPDMDVYYVAGMFLRDPASRRFLVMDGDKLAAVITRKDILRAVKDGLAAG